MENKDIVASDIAFLGHKSKMSSIKHKFINNVLICKESLIFLLPPKLLSFFFGPCLSTAIYLGLIDFTKAPFFAIILLFLSIVISWIVFTAMLLYHKRIEFDFSSKTLIFFKKVLQNKQFQINLSNINKIVSGSIQRVKSNRKNDNFLMCYYFSIILEDNTEIRVCETTKKEELEIIINIILNNCSKKLQWKQYNTLQSGVFNGWGR